MDKNSFVLYSDYLEHFKILSDEEAGILIKAIFCYVSGLDIDQQRLSPAAKMAFSFIKSQLDRDMKAYEIKCNKNKENGKLGGRPKKTNGFNENQVDNRKTNGFNENHNDNDTENDSDSDTENDSEKKYKNSFLDFWEVYPRKIDKGNAYKKYQARLNDGYSESDLVTAATNYADQCRREKTERKFIKHPKTFLSDTTPFVDYLKNDHQDKKKIIKEGVNPFRDE